MRLEDLKPNTVVEGILPNSTVTVERVQWYGSNALNLVYRTPDGTLSDEIIYRDDEQRLRMVESGRPWSFDADGRSFRLVAEAHRIKLAHLFDPLLAVHTSLVEPLPHQITAVYEAMLPRQPLRFLLADDPGAGKTIMAGLLIKELIVRGDLQRCLIVCPGVLVEQWQDELQTRFNLPFEILTNDKLDSARSGNWFMENHLAIARLDKLSRNEDVQQKLLAEDCTYDLIVCDEAHKMSASVFGREIKYTKRHKLGQLLSEISRHFLLMTATPHNGKEQDFQLFLSLLDGDRFEGRYREGVHQVDASDMMRRMVKEGLLRFDGTPLFPERIAHTLPYHLSDDEARLYSEVTNYVREEFNRAERAENKKRFGTVGFALTILQRRLASSPEAIYQSLLRRKKRLEKRLKELQLVMRGEPLAIEDTDIPEVDDEYLEDLEDAPENELEKEIEQIFDQATAARTIDELKSEIDTLHRLETLANDVRRSGEDRKWRELASLLQYIFTPDGLAMDDEVPFGAGPIPAPESSPHQKLVIFTEHRDTLSYLERRISNLLGRSNAISVIHGGLAREDRKKAQENFLHNPDVKILLATDAAGEGINLQRAHLMVNYDLPWNPNRLEQRFGRIHRIGQKEVCHLWNLVAKETREGDVYERLLLKIEEARKALGGKVFDVLGKLQFENRPLRDLLLEAIRYGDSPEVKAKLEKAVENSVNQQQLISLLEEHALQKDVLDTSKVELIRDEMERAEARRLQPHYIESFFLEAFSRLGGSFSQREPSRYIVKNVPVIIRTRDRIIGSREPVLKKYERIVFEKEKIGEHGEKQAAFVCPGHPLLDSVLDLTLEQNRSLLKQGAVLVDERDEGTDVRIMYILEHAIRDAKEVKTAKGRTISQNMLYVEVDRNGNAQNLHYAPYLDYRALQEGDPGVEQILDHPACQWISDDMEPVVMQHAVSEIVPFHLKQVKDRRLGWINKTRKAVQDRLTKEINYWDHRAEELKIQEQAGRKAARMNWTEARRRADSLQERLKNRLEELDLETQISAASPVVIGGLLVVPIGLIRQMTGEKTAATRPIDTQKSAERAREIVMQIERNLGHEPVDRELDKVGYDIESKVPETGRLRFLEVKGRDAGAETITVTKNEILCSLNKPENYYLAVVLFHEDNQHKTYYVHRPFHDRGITNDFNGASVNFKISELITKAVYTK